MPDVKQPATKRPNGGAEPLILPKACCALADFKRNQWEVDVPAGRHVEELFEPGAWATVSGDLSPRDLIYAQSPSWLAILRVRDSWKGGATVLLLQKLELGPIPERVEGDTVDRLYDIRLDEIDGWKIVRRADGTVMATQKSRPELISRRDCRLYIEEHATLRH